MKRLFAVAALAAAFACPTPAHADQAFTNTCGNNTGKYATALAIDYASGVWTYHWKQVCGTGGTMEHELQSSSDGGRHWYDEANGGGSIDHQFTTPPAAANILDVEVRAYNDGCIPALDYRVKVWDADSSSVVYLHPNTHQGC